MLLFLKYFAKNVISIKTHYLLLSEICFSDGEKYITKISYLVQLSIGTSLSQQHIWQVYR